MRASIPRTATFSWSPSALVSEEPLLATGTVAGALDASFSNDSLLELWSPAYASAAASTAPAPRASVGASARFNRLAWGAVSSARPNGLLAAGLDNGELAIWDAKMVLDGTADSQIVKNTTHTGPVKGLHFNPIQSNLLASGAVNGEVYIWDLTNPNKPYSPAARSSKLDEISAAAWNSQVPHILATSSASGYTVVWDLKNKREVTALAYGGGAATGAATLNGGVPQGRRGVGAVCWHPDTPTRLITACDDDASPIIMLWDLRNARAPEKILTGHDKGVLSLSWCAQDADLLLSCGKDNRTLCWNPQLGEIVGEVPSSTNWSFDVQWCPRNPAMLATASFDGQVGVHSLQATNADAAGDDAAAQATAPPADGSDVFGLPAGGEATASKGISLRQPPKWLRRPASVAFGFGGQLVSVSSTPAAPGAAPTSSVRLRDVVTEPSIVARATRLQEALEAQTLADFCDERSRDAATRADDVANWKALQTLFTTGSRDELVALLGFSKEDVQAKVSTAITAYKRASISGPAGKAFELDPPAGAVAATEAAPLEPVAETPAAAEPAAEEAAATEEAPAAAEEPKAEEEDSLFAADGKDASDDIFNNIGSSDAAPAADDAVGPTDAAPAAAAKPARSTFRIYPSEEDRAERLITRALILGDFESAVSLCISSARFADALLLAVKGGPDLLARTQKAYFERRSTTSPYLRLFQSIVNDDLTDVVANADLAEWQEIFVVLCTFAKEGEFGTLAEQLGSRLEAQYASEKGTPAARDLRKNAVLCYLAAGKLEKVAGMWIDEMNEEEKALRGASADAASSKDGAVYSAHAEALQSFMEKITVFKAAVNYVDEDLAQGATGGAYKLASLYERIQEYVSLLADQGLVGPALKYAAQTPADFAPHDVASALTGETSSSVERQRLVLADASRNGGRGAAAAAASTSANGASSSSAAYAPAAPAASSQYDAGPYGASSYAPAVPAVAPAYDPYGASSNQYGASSYGNAYGAPQQQQQQQNNYYAPSVPAVQSTPNNAYQSTQPMVPAPPPPIQSQAPNITLPPPPGATSSLPPSQPLKRGNDGGWNDVPAALGAATRRTGSAAGQKAAPIMSPFPNSPAPAPAAYPGAPHPGSALPPPPRGATPGSGPPQRGAFSPPPPQVPGQQYARPPPGGPMGGPPGAQHQARPPPPGPPRAGAPVPSGPYAPAPGTVNPPPPPSQAAVGPGASQQYAQQSPGFPGQRPLGPPGGVPPRAMTPGAGAGVPARIATPAKPSTKYPPGDRAHIPDAHRPILNVLTRELQRVRASAPPAQKRMVDDAERRLNILFDQINCGTVEPKIVQGLLSLVQAIEARNQSAALSLHLSVASAATGDLAAALVGVKLLISRMNAP